MARGSWSAPLAVRDTSPPLTTPAVVVKLSGPLGKNNVLRGSAQDRERILKWIKMVETMVNDDVDTETVSDQLPEI